MRIGIEARRLQAQTTGFGKYALNLLREFERLGTGDEFLVYLNGPCQNSGLFHNGHVKPVMVPLRPPFYKQIGIPWDIVSKRRSLHLYHFLYNAPSVWTPVPFVLTIHDLSYLHVPHMVSWLNRATAWWQLKLKAAKAAGIITISENSRRDIVRRLRIPQSKITVIYHGVEPAFAPASAEAKQVVASRYGLASPFLLYVGTYLPHKNLETLLRGFGRLVRDWRGPLELVLAGRQGRNSANIKQMVQQLHLESRVRLLGFVPDDDLPALYSLSQAFVYPSRYEGFGLPILEAMACGVPVVAAKSSCLPEVGGDAALYFPPRKDAALADMLRRVLEDRELRQLLVKRGLARAALFSWRAAAERTIEVYKAAIPGPPASFAMR